MSRKHYIACDLGAESGRVILGTLEQGELQLEEVHRFPTGGVRIRGSLRWNMFGIFQQLKQGLAELASRDISFSGLSVDSWGVDYVLLNARQPMLSIPCHYRDSRADAPYERTSNDADREKIFAETGIQFMPLNTLYQLMAEVQENGDLLELADHFLCVADYFHYLFCGKVAAEISMASTTHCDV